MNVTTTKCVDKKTKVESKTNIIKKKYSEPLPISKVNVLRLKKPSSSSQNFDDGYYVRFKEAQPKHIQFYCMTDSGEKESCDVRLYLQALEPDK